MRVNERLSPNGTLELFVDRVAEGYVASAPTVGTYRIGPLGQVLESAPDWEAYGADAETYFTQQIQPLLAQLRGTPNLHGSAVELEGQAIGFLGRSGLGKSTLSASLASAGGRLLADDCITVEIEGDVAWCTPSSASVRLREDSLAAVRTNEPTRPSLGKTEVDLARCESRVALRHLYVLEPTASTIRIEPVRARDALVALATNAHRLDPTDKGLLAAEVTHFERISRAVPMSRLQVPRDFSKLPLVKETLLVELRARS